MLIDDRIAQQVRADDGDDDGDGEQRGVTT